MLLTGRRQGELVIPERWHVDLAREAIAVLGKANKRCVVSLSEKAIALFREIPVRMATRRMFWHSDGEPFRNVATRFSLYGRPRPEFLRKADLGRWAHRPPGEFGRRRPSFGIRGRTRHAASSAG